MSVRPSASSLRQRPSCALLGAVSLAVVVAGGALAAEAQGAEPKTPARAAFERGLFELEAGRYSAALFALEESYRLSPVPVVSYNLALAHRGLGHVTAALGLFRRYLEEAAGKLPEPRARAVARVIAELESEASGLELVVEPATASVAVDGRQVPHRDGRLELDPGEHVVEARASGRRDERRELRLGPGKTEFLRLTLVPSATAPSPTAPAATTRMDSGAAPVEQKPSAIPSGPVAEAGQVTRVDEALVGDDETSLLGRWWFWLGLGVLAIAGGVATGVLAGRSGPEPVGGTAFDVEALGSEPK